MPPPVTISGGKPSALRASRKRLQPGPLLGHLGLAVGVAPARAGDGRSRPGRRDSAAAAAPSMRRARRTASSGRVTPVRPCPTSISTTAPSGRSALTPAARASRPASLSTTTARSTRSRARARRSTMPGAVTGEVTRSPSSPAAAIASASRTVAQHRPTAPASSWRRAIAAHLCAFTCGRSWRPCRRTSSIIATRLCSKASASSSRQGVASRARASGASINVAFGPSDIAQSSKLSPLPRTAGAWHGRSWQPPCSISPLPRRARCRAPDSAGTPRRRRTPAACRAPTSPRSWPRRSTASRSTG